MAGLTSSLGSRIRIIRKENKFSQKHLGGILGVSQQAIARYENDIVEPKISTLINIANLSESKTLLWLIKGYDDRRDYLKREIKKSFRDYLILRGW